MVMKRIFAALIFASVLCVVAAQAASCSVIADIVDGLSTLEITDATVPLNTEAATEPPAENTIPFFKTPEIEPCEMPSEHFADPIEKEASEIIDGAIAKAISYVNAMKDDRHGNVGFSFDEDANGYLSALTAEQKELYDRFVSAGKNCERLTVSEKEYGGDLKAAFFALYEPMTYSEPGIASYFTIDAKSQLLSYEMTTRYTSVFDRYFDPDRDANTDLSTGDVTMEKIKHDAKLLDCVVKRIIGFMPDGLSTYDKYYYLAAVLSEKVSYDKRPDNCFTAYGALIGGRAVCEGYTGAYYLLCREAGLWCAYRNGQPSGVGHTWNMVKLDSGIYNVDVTWCDGYGKPYEKDWYDCFMRSDADFEYDGHNATSGVTGTGDFEPCPYEKMTGR